MRHRNFGRQLGRNHNQRKGLFRNQVKDVFTYGSIKTTEAKAKSVVSDIEHLCSIIVTKSADLAQKELDKTFSKNQTKLILEKFALAFVGQTSNFTKITPIKFRQGDNSLIVKLALVKPFSSLPVKKVEVKKVKDKKEKPAPKVVKVKKIGKDSK
jgi:large subunit ribosomal protein L17